MKASCYYKDCPAERVYPCGRCGRLTCSEHSDSDEHFAVTRCHDCLAAWKQQRPRQLLCVVLFVAVGLLLGIGGALIFGRASAAAEGALLGALVGLVLGFTVVYWL